MIDTKLQVRMLGGFSMCCGEQEISDNDNRSHKVWLLLAYMAYHHGRTVPQEELIRLLWGEDGSANPLNALKTMFHRARTLLDQLYPGAGHELILRQGGNYVWNSTVPFALDAEEFDALCRYCATESDADVRLEKQLQALSIYSGKFLPKLSSESWIVPVSAYYHNQYMQLALDTMDRLEKDGATKKLVELCRKVVQLEPYNETVYQYLMQGLLTAGDQKGAIAVYEDMSQLLYDTFGIMPSDETRKLYREASKTVNFHSASLEAVREQLREPDTAKGALFCDYDFFRTLYHAEARIVTRTGDAVHLAFFTISGQDGQPLSKRSLDPCMDNLQEIIRSSLRRGDIASRYSASQFIVMLLQANYENSCMVCERIKKAFFRRYPHSPADIQYSVQALEPKL